MTSPPFRVAVVQAAPVAFDTTVTLDRVAERVAVAAEQGARVVVIPEAFVGGYPQGSDFGIRLGSRNDVGRAAFERYFAASIDVPGPAVTRLGEIAAEHSIQLVIGVIECDGHTLYCTALFLGEDGALRGKIGAAICWENYMPLLRTTLYAKGIELYCAPTVDDREVWQATMRHIAVDGCERRPESGAARWFSAPRGAGHRVAERWFPSRLG